MGRKQPLEEESKKRKEEEEEEERKEGCIVRWRRNVSLPPIPDTNFASFLLSVMAQHGGKKALMDAATGKHLTYNDICVMVPRVSDNLGAAGVVAGDAVLLLSPNQIDFPIAMLAIQLLPATCVPVSPIFSSEEVAHVVKVSGVRWAVVAESVLGVMEQVTTLLPPNTLKQVWVMGSSQRHPSFSELMRTERQDTPPLQGKDPSFNPARTVALIPFSSGTTGLTKGVRQSHRNLLTIYMQRRCVVDEAREDYNDTEVMSRVLVFTPLCHNYATVLFVHTVLAGGCLVLMRTFSPHTFLDAIQRHKITITPLVPHIAHFLVHTPLLKDFDVSSLMTFTCSTAPLSASTMQALAAKMDCSMIQGYGLTETCVTVAMNSSAAGFKTGSVGHVLPYVDVKIVAPGQSKGLPPGETGEVWVRTPGLLLGYVHDLEAAPCTSLLKEGGWLPTGDLGYCDQDGFLFIMDRIKDVIKVKGYQVYPNELEKVLLEAEGVKEVAVVGVPSSRLGEVPRAYVVPPSEVPAPSPEALKDYVAARLAPHKHLAGGVQVVDALPRNAIGKVLKRQLRDDFLKAEKAAALSSKL